MPSSLAHGVRWRTRRPWRGPDPALPTRRRPYAGHVAVGWFGNGFGYACALVLALVFVRAGVAKAVHRAETATGFATLGIPAASTVARVVPVIEVVLAVALLSVPRIGGVAALITLATFSAFLARALHAGVTAACNCFGQTHTEPISSLDLVRNAMLGGLGASALLVERPVVPTLAATLSALVIIGAGAILLFSARNRSTRVGCRAKNGDGR